MADTLPSLRNSGLRKLSIVGMIGGLLAGLVLSVGGLYELTSWYHGGQNGALLLATGLILMTISVFLYAILEVILQAEDNVERIYRLAIELQQFARRIEPRIKIISDNSQISDSARSLVHREIERETLRQAIREEMVTGDVEATHYLINELERRFGYRQEAQDLRQEFAQMREMSIEEKISEAILRIEKLMDEYKWTRAGQESERLMKLFPRHERVVGLPGEIHRRREARKQELLVQWKAAVERAEVDRGIALLTELDYYLSKEEATALQDSARHVFKARLVNLGVQFGLAASENRWRDALEVGLLIRQEFPNTRMAREVSEKMEVLRIRAGFVADADIVQQKGPPSA